VATDPPLDQRKLALQALLADRFKLKVHHEPKEFSIYNLVVGKDVPTFSQQSRRNLTKL